MKDSRVTPVTRELVNLVVDEPRGAVLKDLALNLQEVVLNNRQLCDFDLLATGVFSPLSGFMVSVDYEAVLDRSRLASGELFPIPVYLDVEKEQALSFEAGQTVALRDQEGLLLGVLHIEDIWEADHQHEARQIYGTTDTAHPGVNHLFNFCKKYYVQSIG